MVLILQIILGPMQLADSVMMIFKEVLIKSYSRYARLYLVITLNSKRVDDMLLKIYSLMELSFYKTFTLSLTDCRSAAIIRSRARRVVIMH